VRVEAVTSALALHILVSVILAGGALTVAFICVVLYVRDTTETIEEEE